MGLFSDRKSASRAPLIVTFYTKEGCCLCDEAREMLATLAREVDLSVKEVDITQHPVTYERFKYAIPVIEVGGEARIGGRFTLADLRHSILEVGDNEC